jgi:hypothetical protein
VQRKRKSLETALYPPCKSPECAIINVKYRLPNFFIRARQSYINKVEGILTLHAKSSYMLCFVTVPIASFLVAINAVALPQC